MTDVGDKSSSCVLNRVLEDVFWIVILWCVFLFQLIWRSIMTDIRQKQVSKSTTYAPPPPPKQQINLYTVDTSLVSRVAYIFCKAGDETVFLDLELCFNRTVELTAVEWEPLEGFKNGFLKGLFWGLKLGESKAWFFSTFTLGPLNFWLTWSNCFRFHVHDVEPIRAHLFNWHAFVRGMSVGMSASSS